MTEPEYLLTITVRGGDHDGDVFDLPAAEAGVGDTINYLDGQYRLARGHGQEWIARVVPPTLG